MATLLEVETKLKELIIEAVYPNGVSQPSVINEQITVGIGFPAKYTLDQFMKAKKVYVSIYPVERMDRNTTRFFKEWQTTHVDSATIALTVTQGNVVTVTGVGTQDQLAIIVVGGVEYYYATQDADPPEDIAFLLGSMIPGATVVGNVITIAGAVHVTAGVGVEATAVQEIKRQEKLFCVAVWSPDVEFRDITASAIDVLLSNIERFVLPDDVYAKIVYGGTLERDDYQTHRIYYREMDYLVEFATTIEKKFRTLVVTELQLEDNRTS